MRILGLAGPKVLALDRTNWKLGSRDVNILVLAIVMQRFRVPLMWSLLDHGGNSSTGQRIALMRRYLRLFEVSSIDALLADREFVGARWLEFLNENNVPFVVRFPLEPAGPHRRRWDAEAVPHAGAQEPERQQTQLDRPAG